MKKIYLISACNELLFYFFWQPGVTIKSDYATWVACGETFCFVGLRPLRGLPTCLRVKAQFPLLHLEICSAQDSYRSPLIYNQLAHTKHKQAHLHLISLTSPACWTRRSVLVPHSCVHDERCDPSLCSASFPSPSPLGFPLNGTVLLPCWGQSSLHCWRQVARDTSTQRHNLNVKRWERWAKRREEVAYLATRQPHQHAQALLRTRNKPLLTNVCP